MAVGVRGRGAAVEEKNRSAEVFPPGEFLKEELDARGWSQVELAEILGRPPRLVSEIIGGKRAVSPETAQGLADAFGTSPQYWMNLESAYQLWKLSQARVGGQVERRARLYGLAPVKELIRRGWLQPSKSIDELESRLCAFLRMASPSAEPTLFPHAARRGAGVNTYDSALRSWLWRVRDLAEHIAPAVKFTDSRLEALKARLRSLLLAPEAVTQVPRCLAEAGIRFVVVEHLPKSRVDGACLWLDRGSPVVAMSLRFDRLDYFWFTLVHEIQHVANRDGLGGEPMVDVDLLGDDARTDLPAAEARANREAADFLIPNEEMDHFIARNRPFYSRQVIAGFAARLRIHPGVVVGRLHHLGESNWSHHRDTLVKVRAFVTEVAMTDGWGAQPRV